MKRQWSHVTPATEPPTPATLETTATASRPVSVSASENGGEPDGEMVRVRLHWTDASAEFWNTLCRHATHATDDWTLAKPPAPPPIFGLRVSCTTSSGRSWSTLLNMSAHLLRPGAESHAINRPRCELLAVRLAIQHVLRTAVHEHVRVRHVHVEVPSVYVADNARADRLRNWHKRGFPGIANRDLWKAVHTFFQCLGDEGLTVVNQPHTSWIPYPPASAAPTYPP